MRISLEPNKKCIVQKVLMRAIQNVPFIEFEPLCQKFWAFMSSFTMTTDQLWSCHVALATNFENFYCSLNSILDFWKNCQIWGKLAQELNVKGKNRTRGGKHPHSTYRINMHHVG